jgi:truncated hemoglobin YjbI
MQELEVYSMIGAEGFAQLVAAFYRQVPQDELLGPMYHLGQSIAYARTNGVVPPWSK